MQVYNQSSLSSMNHFNILGITSSIMLINYISKILILSRTLAPPRSYSTQYPTATDHNLDRHHGNRPQNAHKRPVDGRTPRILHPIGARRDRPLEGRLRKDSCTAQRQHPYLGRKKALRNKRSAFLPLSLFSYFVEDTAHSDLPSHQTFLIPLRSTSLRNSARASCCLVI